MEYFRGYAAWDGNTTPAGDGRILGSWLHAGRTTRLERRLTDAEHSMHHFLNLRAKHLSGYIKHHGDTDLPGESFGLDLVRLLATPGLQTMPN
ncbi:hypothetical protein P170DRAFT_210675 [Aspergillus steynii IBT 23096]|uniref:Uncharacterized protein n=1 Tax=Aspergillus steynii IBT 23096 TaxID=1392250 RepID=A0A2I2G641_9EURO|nr:uncharacterized protein P170DRAFT_210675 [Aspergillus steynii IBT 23096]PLB48342.1 hypothetical protein P170DRAFT_210675 [Aspergillus steynii IBT 23096]